MCRTLYPIIFVFTTFDFNHSCFRHRHLKFQVPCIDSVFGVTVVMRSWLLLKMEAETPRPMARGCFGGFRYCKIAYGRKLLLTIEVWHMATKTSSKTLERK